MSSEDEKPITCSERTCMVLWPCKYVNQPRYATKDCCLCCHEEPLRNIVQIPPLLEISGTWIGANPIPIWWMILRTLCTLALIYMLLHAWIWYLMRDVARYLYIYWTLWVHTASTILMIIKTISTFTIYRKIGTDNSQLFQPLTADNPLWKLYISQSIILQIGVPAIAMLTFKLFPSL